MSKLIDLTGRRFGQLVVIERVYCDKKKGTRWKCVCDCGNITIVLGYHLNSGHTKSCGCIHSETIRSSMSKHNKCNTRLYQIWAGMIKRVTNPNCKSYSYYGERGITVCDEWRNSFESFYDWAIINGYSEELTLDRVDNEKGYAPDNCRWVTRKIQGNNKSNNRYITYKGECKTISQWADFLGMKECTLLWRLRKGWSIEKALLIPVKTKI